jgi:hypothetical protein
MLQAMGPCLPSGQRKAAFLGTFSETYRNYVPDYPNVMDYIKRTERRYKRGGGSGGPTKGASAVARTFSILSLDSSPSDANIITALQSITNIAKKASKAKDDILTQIAAKRLSISVTRSQKLLDSAIEESSMKTPLYGN